MAETILIVDDEKDIRLSLGGLLGDEGFLVAQASTATEALERIDVSVPELVILDLWMQGAEAGFEVLEKIKIEYPKMPVIVISGHGNVETAVKAVKGGAFDYIEKPLSAEKILLTIERALEYSKLTTENQILRNKNSGEKKLLGESEAIKSLLEKIEIVAPTPASVLITGENGVGKELAAHTLHSLSTRGDRPMIEINCAAIAEELVESELFGHEKGAFTGAIARKQGRFDQAHNSTLFLDEIGDMSLKTQAKILRILQEQKFERVGGNKTISVDVRVIAASNKNLLEEIENGNFREDLYYRLNVVPLVVPPLRERRTDIPLLIEHFLTSYIKINNLGQKEISASLMKDLTFRPWPGNVRELKNTIERLAIMSSGPVIDVDPVYADMQNSENANVFKNENLMNLTFKEARVEFEKKYLTYQLEKFNNNVTQTAENINMDRTSLHKKLKSLGLRETDN